MAPKAKNVQAPEDNDDDNTIVVLSEDLSTAEAPEPLPERDYPATITEVTKDESKNGDPMFVVKWKINEEDYPADYDPGNAPGGKTLTQWVVVQDTPAGRYRVRQFIEAIGAVPSKTVRGSDWIGLTASLTIKHEEYEGQQRERIQRVNAA